MHQRLQDQKGFRVIGVNPPGQAAHPAMALFGYNGWPYNGIIPKFL
jgi:hypothetical protein